VLRRRQALSLLGALACSTPALAEEPLAAASAAAGPVLQAELIKTGLYLITGGGGHSLLRLSQAGGVLVGGKSPGSYRPLMSHLRRINKLSDLPLRVLVLPNGDPEQAGNQALFAAAGVAIIAQRNLVLPPPQPAASAAKPPGPRVAFDGSYELRIGGIELRVLHFGPARGNADAVVLFPDLKVLAVGDLYTEGTPQPDTAAGGGLRAWSQVLAELLRLDFDTVVAGAGPVLGRGDLEAFKGRLDALAGPR
jgi:glyoxylase-like metal-dependent hydrolase (beta-lactamase superfamily II)